MAAIACDITTKAGPNDFGDNDIDLTRQRGVKVKASTVLDDDEMYRAKNVVDGKPESCWNSDQVSGSRGF